MYDSPTAARTAMLNHQQKWDSWIKSEPNQKCTNPKRACDLCNGFGFVLHLNIRTDELELLAKHFPNREIRPSKLICRGCRGKGC